MRVLSIDPGLKPGLVELDETGRVWRATHLPHPDWLRSCVWDIAATEGQWYYETRHGEKRKDINNILTLAFRAGFMLGQVNALRYCRVSPQEWRALYGGGALRKEQVQRKIAAELTAPERVLFQSIPRSRHGDVLDAIGIGRAAILNPDRYTWKP